MIKVDETLMVIRPLGRADQYDIYWNMGIGLAATESINKI